MSDFVQTEKHVPADHVAAAAVQSGRESLANEAFSSAIKGALGGVRAGLGETGVAAGTKAGLGEAAIAAGARADLHESAMAHQRKPGQEEVRNLADQSRVSSHTMDAMKALPPVTLHDDLPRIPSRGSARGMSEMPSK